MEDKMDKTETKMLWHIYKIIYKDRVEKTEIRRERDFIIH